MLKKAQAEFAVILGLVIIAIVVAIYAYSAATRPPLEPTALGEEQKAVDTYVKDAMRRASAQTIEDLYNQGGYVDLGGVKYLNYGGFKIAYWQLCSHTDIPGVEKNYEDSVVNILKDTLPDNTNIAGRQVVFDKSRIAADAQFFENKIVLKARVPTSVGGESMPQPFNIEIPAQLGLVSNFASDFAKFQATYRALDYNLLRMMRRSNPDSPYWTPTKGAADGYDFDKDWDDLRPAVEEMIQHTLAHTYAWQKPVLTDKGTLPKNMLYRSWLFEVVKPGYMWGQYKDLRVSLYYGGEDKPLTKSNRELFLDVDVEKETKGVAEVAALIGIRPMVPYTVEYDISFPVVVSVYDSILQKSLKFVTFVRIKDTQIAPYCDVSFTAGPSDRREPDEYYNKCIQGATKPMDLTVLRSDDEPLPGIRVHYDGCDLSITNGTGKLVRNIPDATNAVLKLSRIYSGDTYEMCIDSDELRSKTVYFPVRKSYNVRFYIVDVEKTVNGYKVNTVRPANKKVVASFTRVGNECMDSETYPVSSEKISNSHSLHATDHYNASISVFSTNSAPYEYVSGILTNQFTIEYGEENVYIYVPYLENFGNADLESMDDLFDACGIEPVTHTPYSGSGVCTWEG